MKNKWFIIAVLFPAVIFSQESSSKSHLNIIATVGMAAGESTAKPLFQLTTGFTWQHYFTGIGMGYDQNGFNSFPLFADWRMNFGKKQRAFVYADGGYNFPGSYKKEEQIFKTSDKLIGGFYMDAGIGYRIRLGQSQHLSFSAGYSRKNIAEKKVFNYPCGINPCDETTDDIYIYHYHFNRFNTKLSWEFGR